MENMDLGQRLSWQSKDDFLLYDLSFDFGHPCNLEKGHWAARSVCVIDQKGTGFLIGESLLMTNRHILPTKESAINHSVRFGYEFESAEEAIPKVGKGFNLDPDIFFHCNEKLDYSVVHILGEPGLEFGYIDISLPGTLKLNTRVNIVQHPGAEYKRIATRANQIKFFNDKIIQYLADKEHSSSGSPIFDDNWDIVGLHHLTLENVDSGLVYNQAHRIDTIWQDLYPHLTDMF